MTKMSETIRQVSKLYHYTNTIFAMDLVESLNLHSTFPIKNGRNVTNLLKSSEVPNIFQIQKNNEYDFYDIIFCLNKKKN